MDLHTNFKRAVMLIAMSVIVFMSFAQSRAVSGTVKDTKGETLIGVSIREKGTTNGTVTDFDGKYQLQVKPNSTLVISYVGYATQEIAVAEKSVINAVLEDENSELEELVVVGYGTMRRRDLTGSIQSMKEQDLTAIPTNNVLEALQGKIAGLDLTKSSGQAGSGVAFVIRGNRSLKASNEPLVIVDGFPYGNSIDINPTDIESIEVLKDAASTAIYGTRGANGVILVTTKKGKNEKTKVSFNSYFTFNNVTDYIESFNGDEYIQYCMEGVRTTNGNEWATGSFVPNEYKALELVRPNATEREYIASKQYEDWQSQIFRTGHSQNYELNVSGGNNTTKYSTSLGFMNEGGVIPGNDMQRYNARLNLNQKIFENLSLETGIMYSYRSLDNGYEGAFNQAGKMLPVAKAWNDDGTLNMWPAPGYTTKLNPLYYFYTPNSYVNNTLNKRTIFNAALNWDIIKGLTFRTLFSADIRDRRYGFYNQNIETSPSSGSDDRLYTGWQSQNLLTYSKKIKEHNLQFLAGHEFSSSFQENASARGGQQTTPLTSFHFLASNTQGVTIASSLSEEAMLSVFGRVNYNFADKYLFNMSLRADRSSVLAAGHQWGCFPAAAFAWRFSEESFLKDKTPINNAKLRLSWGISGNSVIDPYETLGGLGIAYNTFEGKTAAGYYPLSLANPDLSWETTASYNAGLDVDMFNSRVSITAEFFVANTTDLLMPSQLPTTSGYASVMRNVGSTRNVGIEARVSGIIFQQRDGFNWSSDFNFSHVKEEITALTGGQTRDDVNAWFVGEPLKVYYDYKKVGIWQINDEEVQNHKSTVGTIKVQDTDGSGSIGPEDRIIYHRSPKFVLGWNNSFSYKGFDLTAFIFARLGQWISVTDYGQIFWNGLENSPKHDYWTPENPTNAYPRPHNAISTGAYTYQSTLQYVDGSFLKLRDVTLGYSLPQSLIAKAKITKLRVYASAKNFFTLTGIKHYDPERGGGESWPMFKQVVFGLNLNF